MKRSIQAILLATLLATPAMAQPFIIPLGKGARSDTPPTPSPAPVAPPQAGPNVDTSAQQQPAPPQATDTAADRPADGRQASPQK